MPVISGGGGSFSGAATGVTFTPAGTIASTNVQAAIEEAVSEAGANPPTVVAGGNLGTTETVDMTGLTHVWLTGTLNANCAVTISNLTSGDICRLLLVQDATGARTLSVNGTTVTINSAAAANSSVVGFPSPWLTPRETSAPHRRTTRSPVSRLERTPMS
jgi:hypothetical protein